MYAGVRGRSAQDAWYRTASCVEYCLLRKCNVSVTAFDLFKAFDQLCRPLIYCAMLKAGWPIGAATAYIRFQESIQVHSSFAGVMGLPAKRP
eukprot:15393269-Alexandrium_andersonii.AAC.1